MKVKNNDISMSDYPFVAEKLAIDSLNALVGAEIGVRTQRDKGFFTRMLDFFTGDDVELQAQINADIITSQRATLNIVKQLIFEETRTKYCLLKVADKLHLVINKLNEHSSKITDLDGRLIKVEDAVAELRSTITQMDIDLNAKIDRVDFNQRRSDQVRYLTQHFKANRLHQNLGAIVSSALYIAQISNLFADEDNHDKEVDAAKSVVFNKLSDKTSPIEQILLADLENVKYDYFSIIGYVTSLTEKPMCVFFNAFSQRKLAKLSNNLETVKDNFAVAKLYDKYNFLSTNILSSQYEIAEQLAFELSAEKTLNK
jgi:hypothetical protein